MRLALLAYTNVIIAANASFANQPARDAGYYTSFKLQRLCAAPSSNNECRTYIAGVVDTLRTGEAVVGSRVCIPRAVTLNTIILAVRQYQTERPGIGHQSAAKIVTESVSAKWPCCQ